MFISMLLYLLFVCSAGIGRTGSFIAIDMGIQQVSLLSLCLFTIAIVSHWCCFPLVWSCSTAMKVWWTSWGTSVS